MLRTLRLAAFALGLSCLALTARAAKQELPPLPFAKLDVQVVRANDTLEAGVNGGFNFYAAGTYFSDSGYGQRLEAANDAINPARQILAGYDFNAVIESRLLQAIPEAGLSATPTLTVVPADVAGPVAAPQDVLLTYTTVMLSPGFRSLDFKVNAHLERREPGNARKARVRKRFIRSYAFHVVVDPAAGDPLAFWNGMPRERYAQVFDEAAGQIAAMLVQDFSAEGRATWWTKPVDNRTVFMGQMLPGHASARDGGVVWSIVGKDWGRSIQGFKSIR